MLQRHSLIQAENSLLHNAVADAAAEQTCSIAHIPLTGDGSKFVSAQFPAVARKGSRSRRRFLHSGQALCPNLHIVQLAVVQRMTVGAHVAEGEILTGNPVGGSFLGSGVDVVVIHRSQLLTVHTQVDHVGAVGCDLVGQTIDMLGRAVDAIITGTDTVVIVMGTVPIADGNKLTVLVAEQEGRIGDSPGSGGGQQHGTAGEAAGGFPLHHPRLVMLQNYAAAQAVNCLTHIAVGNAAMEHFGLIEYIAAIGDGAEFIAIQLPAVIIRTGGTHGRIVNIAFEIADTVMVGIGCRSAAIGSKVELTGGGTDRTVFHLEKAGIGSAGDEEGQGRIVTEVSGGPLQIINQHRALVDGFHRGIAGQRQKNLAIVIVKALLCKS